MDPIAAKYIGAGIAAIGMAGAAMMVNTSAPKPTTKIKRNPMRINIRKAEINAAPNTVI